MPYESELLNFARLGKEANVQTCLMGGADVNYQEVGKMFFVVTRLGRDVLQDYHCNECLISLLSV